MKQPITYTSDWVGSLINSVNELRPDKTLILTDTNVCRLVLDPVRDRLGHITSDVIVVEAGEVSKCLDTLALVWERLARSGCTRRSLLVNLGGGVVSDLGGFAAATFKRGIRFINIPSSLLAMADAAIGGKTGIDFLGFKNEVGAFAPAIEVIIDSALLATLPEQELKSGFAEVVKMALITGSPLYGELLADNALHDTGLMTRAVRMAADEKMRIVSEDPYERGVRRMLNFGHTAGHAYESYAASLGKPVSHGEAVAHGMLKALQISSERNGFPASKVEEYREKILKRYYSPLPFGPEAQPELDTLMAHDKKNPAQGEIAWVLLDSV